MVRLHSIGIGLLAALVLSSCEDALLNEGQQAVVEVMDEVFDYPALASFDDAVPALLSIDDYQRLWADSSDIVLIDMRKTEDYLKGHIPGAFQLWRDDIQSANFPYEGMALEPEALADKLAAFGATSSTYVVVYDGVGGCDAARVWWLLRLYGHERVSLLNGGWHAWQFEGHPAEEAETPQAQPGEFTYTGEPIASLSIDLEDVQRLMASEQVVLLDTRSLEEFTGEVVKPGAFGGGHIPGSVHFDWGRSVEMDGAYSLRPTDVLLASLAEVGVTPDKKIITYCHSGVRSAHTTFVLKELLGFPDVTNYDGSWTEWSYLYLRDEQLGDSTTF